MKRVDRYLFGSKSDRYQMQSLPSIECGFVSLSLALVVLMGVSGCQPMGSRVATSGSGADGSPKTTQTNAKDEKTSATADQPNTDAVSKDDSEAKSTEENGKSDNEMSKTSASEQETVVGDYNELNSKEKYVILDKGTEPPWIGEYTDTKDEGTYICRRCNAALYKSDDKFSSHCGWPSFDDELPGAVERHTDADGLRTEIICKNCGGHLGHVFLGEGFTAKDTRHCVNSISIKLIPAGKPLPPKVKPQN